MQFKVKHSLKQYQGRRTEKHQVDEVMHIHKQKVKFSLLVAVIVKVLSVANTVKLDAVRNTKKNNLDKKLSKKSVKYSL